MSEDKSDCPAESAAKHISEDKLGFLQVLAQIAGIFIAFTALINLSDQELNVFWTGTVTFIGVLILVGSLMPLLLHQYLISERGVWVFSSILLLALIWIGILGALEPIKAWYTSDPLGSIFYWGVLEVAIQLPLILVILGRWRKFDSAFYFTALVINAMQAAWVLAFLMI